MFERAIHRFTYLVVFLLYLILLCGHPLPARAQGSTGANGPNRRVLTTGGYNGLYGDFSEPSIFVPSPNIERSKPTYYMGAFGAGQIVESGMQYESEPQIRSGLRRGWSVYSRFAIGNPIDDFRYARDSSGLFWNRPVGTLGTIRMTFYVTDYGIKLIVSPRSGSGAVVERLVAWPRTPTGEVSEATLAGINVRRVVAMTQRGKPTRDNSYQLGSVFSEGYRSTAGRRIITQNGQVVSNDMTYTWIPWTSTNSSNDIAPPSAVLLRDRNDDWVVDFQGVLKRNPQSGSMPSVPVNSTLRYGHETVDISLLKPAGKLRASKVE